MILNNNSLPLLSSILDFLESQKNLSSLHCSYKDKQMYLFFVRAVIAQSV
jgi:hypothetical protein